MYACKDLKSVTAQGGNNAWTALQSMIPDKGSVTTRKLTGGNNKVSIWTLGDMLAGQEANLLVTVQGNIKPSTACGTWLGLLGEWSAISTSVDLGTQKSANSGKVSATVGPDPCF